MTILSRKENLAIVGTVLITVLLSISNLLFFVPRFDPDIAGDGQRFVAYDLGPPTPTPGLRFLIMLSLIISGAVLLIRFREKFIISIVPLIGALGLYLLWLKESIDLVTNAESKFSDFPHIAYLVNANWLDISVLCGIIILIIWEISILLRPKYK